MRGTEARLLDQVRELLCSACDWSKCDGCGNVFCADCLQLVGGRHRQPAALLQRVCAGGERSTAGDAAPSAQVVCGSTQATAQDDSLYQGPKQPLCCETLPVVA